MWEDGEKYSGAWNFAPDRNSVITVGELVKRLIGYWGCGEFKDLSEGLTQPYEAKLLMLDNAKAVNLLGWKPVLSIDEAIKYTVDWYKNPDVDYGFCVRQIENYVIKKEV
jgi:CDP-glucose 4,6-dehydratase